MGDNAFYRLQLADERDRWRRRALAAEKKLAAALTPQDDVVEKVGLALQAAWDDTEGLNHTLPPIDLSKHERSVLARACLEAIRVGGGM